MMSFLSAVVTSRYPTTNNQLRNSSNPRTYTPGASGSNSGKQRTVICYNCKGEGHMSKQCTKPKRKLDDSWFKDKVLLVHAQANGQIIHEEELAFLADPGTTEVALMANLSHYGSDALAEVHNPDNVDNNMINQGVQVMPSSEQSNVVNHSETEITSDSNIIPYSQYVTESQQAAVQNSNSSAQQDALILSVIEQLKTQVINCTKINLDNKSVNDTLTAELKRYKEQVKVLKEGQNVDLKSKDNVLDSCEQSVEIDRLKQTLSEHLKEKESLMQTVTLLKNDFKKEESRNIDREIALEKKIKQLDNIVYKRDQSAQTVHMLTKPQFFYDHTTKQALGFQNPFYLKKAQQLEPKLYDGNVIKNTSAIVIPDSEETLMLAEESHSKMLLKQQDPMVLEKKVNTTPADYANSMNSSDPSPSCRPTKVEVPKELPKVSMVNTSLKKLKHHLAGFDVVVKERTMATTIKVDTQLNQEIFQRDNSVSNQSAPSFDQLFELNELKAQSQEKDTVIKKLKERIKSLSGKMNEDKIKKDLEEIETINIELDHRVSKLIAENEHLKQTYKQLYDSIKPARIRSKEQCDDLINQVNLKSVEISDLNASLQEKVLEITALKDDLRKLKGKALVDNVVTKHTIDPEMLKIDVEPITPKLLNKKTAHSAYIKHTQEEATVLRDLVEHVKSKYPLDHTLESAYRYAKLIQELLTHISKTSPSVNNIDGKLVAVTPTNKDKRVRFTETVTSSGNTITKTASTSNLVSNKHMLSSTGVKPSTSASGSQPSGNTKKDKIRQTPRSTQKNKVVTHPRKVKSSLKNKDCVIPPKGTAHVQHSKLNANSELKCVKCNGCMLSDNHDLCVLDFINNVNARAKSKSIKNSSKRKVLKSVSANKKEPSPSWGSIVFDVPSSSLDECRSSKLFSVKFGNDHVTKILGYGDYQIRSVTISRILRQQSVYSVSWRYDGVLSYMSLVKCLNSLGDMHGDSNVQYALVRRTDNGTEFVNQTLREYYKKVGISHETSVARSPQQNGVFERA
ncbi:retrovirus-related pol polyprotein from transposon TNT 1-94 [Tanacetum coccineum]